LRMLRFDFKGWADNLSGSGIMSGDVPSWLLALGLALGAAGAAVLGLAWIPESGGYLGLLLGILVLNFVLEAAVAEMAPRNILFSLGHALALGAGLGWLARFVVDSAVLQRFTLVVPFVAALAAPLLLRIWNATLFSLETHALAESTRARVNAAMASKPEDLPANGEDLVVRVDAVRDGEADLAICFREGERPARAAASLLQKASWLRPTHYYLLIEPVIEKERAAGSGYRDTGHILVVQSAASVRWAGHALRDRSHDGLLDEARAGAVVMVLYHALVAGAAYGIARAMI
jgi:hypothetical protein